MKTVKEEHDIESNLNDTPNPPKIMQKKSIKV